MLQIRRRDSHTVVPNLLEHPLSPDSLLLVSYLCKTMKRWIHVFQLFQYIFSVSSSGIRTPSILTPSPPPILQNSLLVIIYPHVVVHCVSFFFIGITHFLVTIVVLGEIVSLLNLCYLITLMWCISHAFAENITFIGSRCTVYVIRGSVMYGTEEARYGIAVW